MHVPTHMKHGRIVEATCLLYCIACLGLGLVNFAWAESEETKLGKESPMKATLKREGNKIWLEGVEPHQWAERCNSIVNCLTGARCAAGEDVHLRIPHGRFRGCVPSAGHPGGPCPCAPHASLGYRCTDRAAQAAGYNLEWININKDDPDSIKKARDAAIKSIDEGCPALWSSEERHYPRVDTVMGPMNNTEVMAFTRAEGELALRLEQWVLEDNRELLPGGHHSRLGNHEAMVSSNDYEM